MNLCIYIMIGMCFGSMYDVVTLRMLHHQDFIWSRSRCESCGHELKWKELVPVISFILQKGRCNYCGNKISFRILLVEICGGIVGGYFGYVYGMMGLILTVMFFHLWSMSYIDYKTYLVHDGFLLIFLMMGILFVGYQDISIFDRLLHIFSVSGCLWIMNQWKKGFGDGDLLFFMIIGFLLGYKVWYVLWLAVVLCGFVCMYKLFVKKENGMIGFIPYISIAFLIVWMQSLCI